MSLQGSLKPEKVLRGRVDFILKIDKTLSVEGASADSKAVGEALKKLEDSTNKSIEGVNTKIVKAQSTANQAKENAGEANSAAKKAQSTANEGKQAAGKAQEDINAHLKNLDNPHGLTAAQLGIGKVIFQATIGTEWAGTDRPYTQTVAVAGILEKDDPKVDLLPADGIMQTDEEEEAFGLIRRIKTNDGSITVYASDKTLTPINIQMEEHRLDGSTEAGDYEAVLNPGNGAVAAVVAGESYPMKNTEIGETPSAGGNYCFDII